MNKPRASLHEHVNGIKSSIPESASLTHLIYAAFVFILSAMHYVDPVVFYHAALYFDLHVVLLVWLLLFFKSVVYFACKL